MTISPLTNFIYQLDCISGKLRSCGGREDFIELWRSHFNVDAATDPAIQRWAALGKRVDGGYAARVRIASLAATSLDDYFRRVDILLPKTEAHAVRTIAAPLYPRFAQWWAWDPGHNRALRVKALRQAVASAPLVDELPRLYTLFNVPADASRINTLALLYRPGTGDTPPLTTGEYLGDDYAVAEFSKDEALPRRLSVILHEYTHYVFGMMPADEREALRTRIVATGPNGAAAWSLFNEAMATAFGNGHVYRELAKPDDWAAYSSRPMSFYNSEPIDVSAKAIVPLVDATLASNGSVTDPAFAKRYADALDAPMHDLWQSPALVLTEFKTIADKDIDYKVFDYAIRTLQTHSVWYDSMACCDAAFTKAWNANAGFSRVAFIHKLHIVASGLVDPALAKDIAVMPEGKSMIVITHAGQFPDVVVVGDTFPSIEAAINQLAKMRSVNDGTYPVEGIHPNEPVTTK